MSYTVTHPVKASGQYYVETRRANGNLTGQSWERRDLQPFTASATKGENPGWRRDIAAGRDATTSFNGVDVIVHEYEPGEFIGELYPGAISSPSYYTYANGMMQTIYTFVPGNPSSNSYTEADNTAKSEFLKKCISVQEAFTGGVFLGELRDTLRMIKNPARALRSGLDDYFSSVKKRTRRSSSRSKNRIVQDTWLEYSFGWTPLIADIDNGSEALSRLHYETTRKYISAFGESRSTTHTGAAQQAIGSWNCWWNQYTDIISIVKYYGLVDSSALNPTRRKLGHFGFRPQSFLPTVWELIPYSFLVDYFTNIGDIINGFSNQRSGLKWSSKVIRKSNQDRRESETPTSSVVGTQILLWRSPKARIERTEVIRSKYFGNFIPSITFQIPGFEGNAKKYLNVAALARMRKLR